VLSDGNALDRYRLLVEHLLRASGLTVREEDIERFFSHVITCFQRPINTRACALEWVALSAILPRAPARRRRRPSRRTSAAVR
jgi:hypothetical protein